MHYSVDGGNLPVLRLSMDPGEWVDCEYGAMSWMDDGIQLQLDNSSGITKMVGKMFNRDQSFMQKYVAKASGEIAFAAKAPGSIKAVTVHQNQGIVVQKGCCLACVGKIQNEVYLQKRLGTGFYGNDGFLLRHFTGEGIVFVEIEGSAFEYAIPNGGSKVVEAGFMAAMTDSCHIDLNTIDGVPNVFFGGEPMFNTTINGPGKVYLQSMPIGITAAKMYQYVPQGK